MPSPKNLELLQGDGDSEHRPHRLDLAIEALRARVDQEFQISERLDSKARQGFGLVAAVFAVAQAVAFGNFRAGHLSGPELVILAVLAVGAACLVLLTGSRLSDSEEAKPTGDIHPDAIARWTQEKNDRAFAEQLVVELGRVAKERHAGNENRRLRYQKLESTARVALIMIIVEMLFAIAFRA
jgi:hypothetical protein